MKHLASNLRVLGLIGLATLAAAHTADPYSEGILKWRQDREDRLKAARGWLTVAGLFWLSEGESTLGSDRSSNILLPPTAPGRLGTVLFEKGTVTLKLAEGVSVVINGAPKTGVQILNSDAAEKQDKVTVGSLTFTIIQRGKRIGIRLYDENAETKTSFQGCKWFPIDPAYRVRASFTPYLPPRKIAITNVLGDTSFEPCIGEVNFVLNGKKCSLQALDDGDDLFFILRDKTSGESTYDAGRFLYTPKPQNGYVDIDFNKAENPPCAFTSFATCPLPPKKNFLPVAVEAGEKKDGHHG